MDIPKEISEGYGIDVYSTSAYRDSYIVDTSLGRKLFKKSAVSPIRILFINSVKNHIKNCGFDRIDSYILSLDGNPFIAVDDENYILTDYYAGRECNFESTDELIAASQLLASLHKAGRGYMGKENIAVRNSLGQMPDNFNRRLEGIKKAVKTAKKGKEQFDYYFLKYSDMFIEASNEAIERLQASSYQALVEKAQREGSVCHHDYTHQNIVCNNEGMSLINFDQCCLELKEYDLANFLRRKLRRCNWDAKQAILIVGEYIKKMSISPEEFEILIIILKFPQKFWRVVNRYYNGRHNWSQNSQINALHEVVDELIQQKKFFAELESWAKKAL